MITRCQGTSTTKERNEDVNEVKSWSKLDIMVDTAAQLKHLFRTKELIHPATGNTAR